MCSRHSYGLAVQYRLSDSVSDRKHQLSLVCCMSVSPSCLEQVGFPACTGRELNSACATSLAHPECVRVSGRMQTVFSAHSVMQMIPKRTGFACTLVLNINLPGNSFYGLPSFRFEPQKVKINLGFR